MATVLAVTERPPATGPPPAGHRPGPYERVRALLGDDLLRFESELDEALAGQREYLTGSELGLYRRGKKLRPILLLLSHRAASAQDGRPLEDRTVKAAVALEIIHVGSLIHDDIIDRAPLRRGLPTISASRGYELAMLIGDLQFIEAARLFAGFIDRDSDLHLMRRFLETGSRLCRGQLDELLSEPDIDPEVLVQRYYRTVDRKTGQLIAFACEAGGRLGNGPPTAVGSLRRFGELVGRAFQVMDDVLDIVRPTENAGKEALTDMAQGRLSLPLIYTLMEVDRDHPLSRILYGETHDESDLRAAAEAVRRGDGWIRAYSEARAIVAKAKLQLALIADSPYRQALMDLCDHFVDQRFSHPG